MAFIDDIYKQHYLKNTFSYVGTLRNEKRFEIDDKIYFAYQGFAGNEIAKGIIVGVEKSVEENPTYTYKIRISGDVIESNCIRGRENGNLEDQLHDYKYTGVLDTKFECDVIFASKEDAKKSAIQNLEHSINLQRKEIERYFG